MTVNHNALNVGRELDPATTETIERAQLVKFATPEAYERGHPKSAGEYHAAVLCREPGDILTFDITSQEANVDSGWMDLGKKGAGAVWVVTESGNRYGICNGFVYNHNDRRAYPLDPNETQLQLQIGKEAFLPGAGTTSPIKSVLLSDEISPRGKPYSWTGRDVGTAPIVNEPFDPLLHIRAIGDAVDMGTDPGIAVADLMHGVSQRLGKASFV